MPIAVPQDAEGAEAEAGLDDADPLGHRTDEVDIYSHQISSPPLELSLHERE